MSHTNGHAVSVDRLQRAFDCSSLANGFPFFSVITSGEFDPVDVKDKDVAHGSLQLVAVITIPSDRWESFPVFRDRKREKDQ